MANELILSAGLQNSAGDPSLGGSTSKLLDFTAGDLADETYINVSSTPVAAHAALAKDAAVMLRNMGAVDVGIYTDASPDVLIGNLKPGAPALIPVASTVVLTLKTASGAAQVYRHIVELTVPA